MSKFIQENIWLFIRDKIHFKVTFPTSLIKIIFVLVNMVFLLNTMVIDILDWHSRKISNDSLYFYRPHMDFFAIPPLILSHLELTITVMKINFNYFNGYCDYPSCLGWSILFLYKPAHKGLAFSKNYIWPKLPLS